MGKKSKNKQSGDGTIALNNTSKFSVLDAPGSTQPAPKVEAPPAAPVAAPAPAAAAAPAPTPAKTPAEPAAAVTTTSIPLEEGSLTRIKKLSTLSSAYIGHEVKLHGWVYSTRTQGAGTLVFIDLGDGSTVTPIRCVAQQQQEGTSGDATLKEGDVVYTRAPSKSAASLTGDEALYPRLSFDDLTQSSQLSIGCSILLIGHVSAPPAGTSQTFEIKILDVTLIGGVADPSKYPIQKSILKKPLALRQQYHARFRAPLIQQLMTIRSETLFAIHSFFQNEKVPLLDPNIMTASDCEGAGEVFKISPNFFHNVPENATPEAETALEKAHVVGLTVSSQLPLEAIAMGTGAVYTCQKSFRAEKSDTNKHLCEFLHVEYEEYFIGLEDLLDQAERYIKFVVARVLETCAPQYEFLNQKFSAPVEFHGHGDYLRGLLEKPFIRIKHADAIALMIQDLRDKVKTINDAGKEVKLKFKVKPMAGEDLGTEHEKYLVKKFGTFVFVTHWPSAIKSFYMKQCDVVEGSGLAPTCESFDLLAPQVGELFGGSMREWRYDVLMDQMTKKNMEVGPLQWFVDLRKDGTAPHGGWGMGFDRLVMFLTNAASVRDIVPYPVYWKHCPY